MQEAKTQEKLKLRRREEKDKAEEGKRIQQDRRIKRIVDDTAKLFRPQTA